MGFSQKDSSYDKYKYRTLSEIITLNREGTDQILNTAKLEEKHGFIGIDPYYSRIRVQYVGTPRTISPKYQGLLKTWSKLQRVDEKFTSLYEKEVLFKECNNEYWIPVQKPIGEAINKKLKTGEMVTLFVIYIGAQKDINVKEFDSLFVLTDYEK